MIEFPGERRTLAELHQQLLPHLSFAKRLLHFWISTEKDRGFADSGLPLIVLQVVMAMAVRASRQFRSVIELCQRGEAADAAILGRSMFETALVLGFVLKPRFVPRHFDKKGKASRIIVPRAGLTRELRAKLYVAHVLLQPERDAARHAERPGMKQQSRRMSKALAQHGLTLPAKTAIGTGWTDILMKRPYTYSGLRIADLARSLGKPFPKWYDIVYGSQSEHVHASDLLYHIQPQGHATTPRWHGEARHVCRALSAGTAMFYAAIGILNKHVGLGVVVNTALHSFHDEYRRLQEAEQIGC